MADNVAIKSDASATVATIRTDEDVAGSGHVQYMKLMYGTDGTFNIVSASSGLPVDGSAVTQPVSLVSVPSHAVSQSSAANDVQATGAWAVKDFPQASGGLSTYSFLSGTGVQSASIKSSPGQIYNMQFFNSTSGVVYVKFYNQTTAPSSSDGANIIWRGMIPGATTGGGYAADISKGISFSTGIGIMVTGGVGSGDATGLTSDSIIGNIGYK